MRIIRNHSSCVIIEAEKTGEFLFNEYDHTYPIHYFRGAINFIGGNYKREDKSPLDVLLREIKEELSTNQDYINHKEKELKNLKRGWRPPEMIKSFSSEKDISSIRNEIILKILPYKDYLWSFPHIKEKKAFNSICSVYLSKINQNIFELVRKNLNESKNIKNEGFAKIYSLNDIKNKKVICSWATPCILSYYKDTILENPYDVKIKYIGKPRESMQNYTKEFIYKIFYV